jgi:hypothetical protein
MPNPFDTLSDRVFAACEKAMGYDATWTPDGDIVEQTARVLFGQPTKPETLGEYGDEYHPHTFFMEYWDGKFDGLFESVRDGGVEHVEVNGTSYFVRDIIRKYDGRNFKARLEAVTS